MKKICIVAANYYEDITKMLLNGAISEIRYKYLLPPLVTLNIEKQKELLDKLKELDFFPERKAA